MRVLVLSQYYDPEPIPLPGAVARALAARGHEVTVVTGLPNYPSGTLYPGYRARLVQREKVEAVDIVRTYEYPYHGKSPLLRILNYFSFLCSSVAVLLCSRRFDVIYTWHPPLTVGLAAWLVGRLRRTPFVYDVQDIWPESTVVSGMVRPGRVATWMDGLASFVYKRAAHILAVTQAARDHIVGRGARGNAVSVMPRWIDDCELSLLSDSKRDDIRRELQWTGRFVVLFAGNIGAVQGLDTVLEAAELLRDHPEVTIIFAGDGCERQRLIEAAAQKGLGDRVCFPGVRSRTVAAEWMQAADINLVHLLPSRLPDFVIPTKTYSCMASGQPVLMAVDGAPAALVEAAQCGLTAPPGNAVALAEGVTTLMAMSAAERRAMGRRGNAYIAAHHRRNVVFPLFEALLLKQARTDIQPWSPEKQALRSQSR